MATTCNTILAGSADAPHAVDSDPIHGRSTTTAWHQTAEGSWCLTKTTLEPRLDGFDKPISTVLGTIEQLGDYYFVTAFTPAGDPIKLQTRLDLDMAKVDVELMQFCMGAINKLLDD